MRERQFVEVRELLLLPEGLYSITFNRSICFSNCISSSAVQASTVVDDLSSSILDALRTE